MDAFGPLKLFPEDFGADAAGAATPPPPEEEPPPPSYGQAELDEACAGARAEGHAQGLRDAAAADSARIADTVAHIGEKLADAAESAARATEQSVEVFAHLLLSSMLAGYPRLGSLHGAEELRALLRQAMPGMVQERWVIFHVHPSMVPAVNAELASVRQSDRMHMTIEPSPEIPPGDCRVTWPDGAMVRDTVQVMAKIADILRPLGLLPEPEAADVSSS
jgi:hypothetical protein